MPCSQSSARVGSSTACTPETRSSSRSSTATPVTRSRSATSCSPAKAAISSQTDGLTVAAEIVAQAKGDKVTVFKKRRRHNYRRKKGHRQQHTILKIVAIGDHKAEKKAAPKAEAAPAEEACCACEGDKAKSAAEPAKVDATPTENPAPNNEAAGQPAGRRAPTLRPRLPRPRRRTSRPPKPRRQKMLHLLRAAPRRPPRASNQDLISSWHIRKQAARPATAATVRASASA